jgi:hypothetical protein
VNVSDFLKDGDQIDLLDPKDPFGKPIASATCRNATIRVPVEGEFGVFLVSARRH